MVAVRAACAALAVLACACAVVGRIRRAQGGFVSQLVLSQSWILFLSKSKLLQALLSLGKEGDNGNQGWRGASRATG